MTNHIRTVKIRNFESFEEADIDFSDGLNILIGKSHCGKTTIVNAISWVLFNNLPDNGFIRDEKKPCSVEVCFDDFSIRREKSAKENIYVITKSGKSEKFSSVGNTVPEVIQTMTGIKELQVDGDYTINVNIASQKEPLFVIDSSGHSRSKLIGRLSKANIVDSMIQDFNRDSRNCTSSMKSSQLKLDEYKSSLEKLSHVEHDMKLIKKAKEQYAETEKKIRDRDAWISLRDRKNRVKKSYSALKALLQPTKTALERSLSIDVDLAINLISAKKDLSEMKSNYKRMKQWLEKINSALEKASSIDVSLAEKLISTKKNSTDIQNNQDTLKKKLKDIEYNLARSESEFSELIKREDKCPICKRSLTDVENSIILQ